MHVRIYVWVFSPSLSLSFSWHSDDAYGSSSFFFSEFVEFAIRNIE